MRRSCIRLRGRIGRRLCFARCTWLWCGCCLLGLWGSVKVRRGFVFEEQILIFVSAGCIFLRRGSCWCRDIGVLSMPSLCCKTSPLSRLKGLFPSSNCLSIPDFWSHRPQNSFLTSSVFFLALIFEKDTLFGNHRFGKKMSAWSISDTLPLSPLHLRGNETKKKPDRMSYTQKMQQQSALCRQRWRTTIVPFTILNILLPSLLISTSSSSITTDILAYSDHLASRKQQPPQKTQNVHSESPGCKMRPSSRVRNHDPM